MSALLQIALSNAVGATVLAVGAALAGWILRRPPLTRALWVLVLLKLLTPPIWHVHVPRLGTAPVTHTREPIPSVSPSATEVRLPSREPPIDAQTFSTIPMQEPPDLAPAEQPFESHHPSAWRQVLGMWPLAVAVVWLTGTAVHLVLLAVSIGRIRSLTRRASPADPGTIQRAAQLAGRLGLRKFPEVLFVGGPISPMLCAVGLRPRLLLPRDLWEKLDDRQRDTVLMHELAHLRRRDHWLRTLEVVVAALYWWDPVVWYARKALREASEQCCDAWVLWALPRSAASYATALIEAIDFISTVRPAVPALASGMGQFTDLKRRLVMIRQGTAAKALSWPVFGSICGAAAILLPLAPSFGQVAGVAVETTPANKTVIEVAPTGEIKAVDPTSGAVASVTVPDGSVAGGTASLGIVSADNIGNGSPDIEAARRDVERARAQLARAEERLARIEGREAGRRTSSAARSSFERGRAGAGATGNYSLEERGAANRIGNAAGNNQQQRLDALENQVREILNELRQMKRDQQRGRDRNNNREENGLQAK